MFCVCEMKTCKTCACWYISKEFEIKAYIDTKLFHLIRKAGTLPVNYFHKLSKVY